MQYISILRYDIKSQCVSQKIKNGIMIPEQLMQMEFINA